MLNDWIAQDLNAKPSDEVHLKYHLIGSHGELPEVEKTFRVAGILKLTGPAADPGLVPVAKGITDAKNHQRLEAALPNASRSRHASRR